MEMVLSQLHGLSGFIPKDLLGNHKETRLIALLGDFDGKDAILTVQPKPWSDDDFSYVHKIGNIVLDEHNSEYWQYSGESSLQVKFTLTCPATARHIEKWKRGFVVFSLWSSLWKTVPVTLSSGR